MGLLWLKIAVYVYTHVKTQNVRVILFVKKNVAVNHVTETHHIHTYMYLSIHASIHLYIYTHTRSYIFMSWCMYVCKYVLSCTFNYTFQSCIYVIIRNPVKGQSIVHRNVCTNVNTSHTCVSVQLLVLVCMYMYMYMYIYIYIYIIHTRILCYMVPLCVCMKRGLV